MSTPDYYSKVLSSFYQGTVNPPMPDNTAKKMRELSGRAPKKDIYKRFKDHVLELVEIKARNKECSLILDWCPGVVQEQLILEGFTVRQHPETDAVWVNW